MYMGRDASHVKTLATGWILDCPPDDDDDDDKEDDDDGGDNGDDDANQHAHKKSNNWPPRCVKFDDDADADDDDDDEEDGDYSDKIIHFMMTIQLYMHWDWRSWIRYKYLFLCWLFLFVLKFLHLCVEIHKYLFIIKTRSLGALADLPFAPFGRSGRVTHASVIG